MQNKIDREVRCPSKISLKMIVRSVGQVTGIDEEALRSKSRDRAAVGARALIVGVWKETGENWWS